MIGQKLEMRINDAIKRANVLQHEYLTLENVFLSILKESEVKQVLENCGADLETLQQSLSEYLEDTQNFSVLSAEQIEELNKEHFIDENLRNLAAQNGIKYQPELSVSLQRVIQRAAMHIQSAGKSSIQALNLLVALMQEEESYGKKLLEKQGVTRLRLLEEVSHGLEQAIHDSGKGEETPGQKNKPKTDVLENFAVNLIQQAVEGQIDPIIGRDEELQRIQEVLLRRRKNNPLVVGDAGVGKTALVEGFALLVSQGDVASHFKDAKIYTLDIASVLAGAKFRGDFEQRLKGILESVHQMRKNTQKEVILFIDEIHTIMGAGSTGGGSMDASNLLKPYLSSGKIKIIGSTTHEEYRKFVEKDAAFRRRFQKVDLDEPSREESIKILHGVARKLQEYHKVKISKRMVEAAVDLSIKYISDRHLPDKAIDVLDESCAAKVLHKSKGNEVESYGTLRIHDLEKVVSKLAHVPTDTVNNDEKDVLKDLNRNLKLVIYGQDEVIDQVSETILVARSGLTEESKPIASFLFAGPTGVGKTEVAKQLANLLGNKFIRFDMSEYMEKHTVSKLIGAPPGYVGHDQGGLLTDQVNKNPYSVVLLDEIEKAHPDLFNILLQVMDNGFLTDSQGRKTDFRNTVIILTTNVGAREADQGTIGLGNNSTNSDFKAGKALKNFFSPEFRNRLNSILNFNSLSEEQIEKIVEKFITLLKVRVENKGHTIDVDPSVIKWIAKIGYDPKMGARPLERMVLEKVSKPLAKQLVFQNNKAFSKISIQKIPNQDELEIKFLS